MRHTYETNGHAAAHEWGRPPRPGDLFGPDQEGNYLRILTVKRTLDTYSGEAEPADPPATAAGESDKTTV